ncbi:mechanosensitive ion channel family protein [Candidatus Parcubacteria bacterium]|nr:mechanosensitive ion channel family protein [Candidatus Parcubacteria bacterium]
MILEEWISDNQATIITIVLVLAGAWLVSIFGGALVRKTVKKAVRGNGQESYEEERKREDTIITIIIGAMSLLIWPMALLVIVSQLGVNIAPLIAGVGILGLAVGFGAQNFVKDMISGLFIIAENQYRVGDVVQLNSESIGVVEKISLRATILRDLDGIVYTVPNGNIEITANYSKEHSGINLDIGVSYDTNLEKAIKVINKTCMELAKDPDWSGKIIETPQFLRVEDFADSAIILKITGTTKPIMQWGVTGELRKRLKIAFDKEKIEIPFPQRVIHSAKK